VRKFKILNQIIRKWQKARLLLNIAEFNGLKNQQTKKPF